MKDRAIEIVRNAPNPKTGKNMLREYLQHVILRKIFELKLSSKLVFHGGTALRIIHRINRYSEDLDFHLLNTEQSIDFTSIVQSIVKELELNTYSVTIKTRSVGAVKTAYFKFSGIFFECGLSPLRSQNLIIKFDIDSNPPLGFNLEKTKVNTYLFYSVMHHDPPSFLAGKLHAVLQRSYTKGRDIFDLAFYLTRFKNMNPNFQYLNTALKQTGYKGEGLNEQNWKQVVSKKISNLDWTMIEQDVLPFLESDIDLEFIEKGSLLNLLKKFSH